MAIFVDKFNKLHRLVSHHREADFQSCVAVVANQMFGSTAVYVDVKQGLTTNDIVTIPSGYVIDITEASVPRLFIVKAVIARHFPFWNTGVELFKFVTSFDGAQGAIRAFLHEQIANDTEALTRLEARAADVPAGADGLLFLPYLVRAETPHWDPAARGAWVGLRDHHDLGHLYRALLEGIAYEQALVLSMIEQDTGTRTERLRLMGGGARSGLWVQLIADIFERPVEVTEHAETTALGAAVLAAAAVGIAGDSDVTATARRMSRGWREVTPREADRERYRRQSRAYRQLYPALAEVFEQLAD